MSQKLNSHIVVRLSREGLHYWPGAGAFPAVAFLQHPHRHMFHVSVQISVKHDDRELEFFLFRQECEEFCTIPRLDEPPVAASCEKFARDLAERILAKYPDRQLTVRVSEDGENEAIITTENTTT